MESEAQSKIILDFMLSIAGELMTFSLENGSNASEAAALVLESSMALAAHYHRLNEALTIAPQNPAEKELQKTSKPAEAVHKAQARIPVEKSEVPDLPGSKERRHPSPLSPDWKPPTPYV